MATEAQAITYAKGLAEAVKAAEAAKEEAARIEAEAEAEAERLSAEEKKVKAAAGQKTEEEKTTIKKAAREAREAARETQKQAEEAQGNAEEAVKKVTEIESVIRQATTATDAAIRAEETAMRSNELVIQAKNKLEELKKKQETATEEAKQIEGKADEAIINIVKSILDSNSIEIDNLKKSIDDRVNLLNDSTTALESAQNARVSLLDIGSRRNAIKIEKESKEKIETNLRKASGEAATVRTLMNYKIKIGELQKLIDSIKDNNDSKKDVNNKLSELKTLVDNTEKKQKNIGELLETINKQIESNQTSDRLNEAVNTVGVATGRAASIALDKATNAANATGSAVVNTADHAVSAASGAVKSLKEIRENYQKNEKSKNEKSQEDYVVMMFKIFKDISDNIQPMEQIIQEINHIKSEVAGKIESYNAEKGKYEDRIETLLQPTEQQVKGGMRGAADPVSADTTVEGNSEDESKEQSQSSEQTPSEQTSSVQTPLEKELEVKRLKDANEKIKIKLFGLANLQKEIIKIDDQVLRAKTEYDNATAEKRRVFEELKQKFPDDYKKYSEKKAVPSVVVHPATEEDDESTDEIEEDGAAEGEQVGGINKSKPKAPKDVQKDKILEKLFNRLITAAEKNETELNKAQTLVNKAKNTYQGLSSVQNAKLGLQTLGNRVGDKSRTLKNRLTGFTRSQPKPVEQGQQEQGEPGQPKEGMFSRFNFTRKNKQPQPTSGTLNNAPIVSTDGTQVEETLGSLGKIIPILQESNRELQTFSTNVGNLISTFEQGQKTIEDQKMKKVEQKQHEDEKALTITEGEENEDYKSLTLVVKIPKGMKANIRENMGEAALEVLKNLGTQYKPKETPTAVVESANEEVAEVVEANGETEVAPATPVEGDEGDEGDEGYEGDATVANGKTEASPVVATVESPVEATVVASEAEKAAAEKAAAEKAAAEKAAAEEEAKAKAEEEAKTKAEEEAVAAKAAEKAAAEKAAAEKAAAPVEEQLPPLNIQVKSNVMGTSMGGKKTKRNRVKGGRSKKQGGGSKSQIQNRKTKVNRNEKLEIKKHRRTKRNKNIKNNNQLQNAPEILSPSHPQPQNTRSNIMDLFTKINNLYRSSNTKK